MMMVGFVLFYTSVYPFTDDSFAIKYTFDYVESDFEVKKITKIRGIENEEGIRVLFKGNTSSFYKEFYDDYAEVEEGVIYKGYEIMYTAIKDDVTLDHYVTSLFYLQPTPEYAITYAEFKEQTVEKYLSKRKEDYDIRYRNSILSFYVVASIILILILYIRYKLKCALYHRKLVQKKQNLYLKQQEVEKHGFGSM